MFDNLSKKMNEPHLKKIADDLNLSLRQVSAAARLITEGATVPFIARYRKEVTDSLDEVAITAIRDKMAQLEALDNRRESILKSLKERELLTDHLYEKIISAETMTTLEDIYLPYRPKRRTRGARKRLIYCFLSRTTSQTSLFRRSRRAQGGKNWSGRPLITTTIEILQRPRPAIPPGRPAQTSSG